MSRNGRYVRTEQGTRPAAITVFEVRTGAILLEDPPIDMVTPFSGGFSGYWPAPSISEDGRLVLNPTEGAFYELGDAPGEAIRIAKWIDATRHIVDFDWRGTVMLSERLDGRFPMRQLKWIFGSEVEWLEEMSDCWAVHDLRSGAFHFRCDEPKLKGPEVVRNDGTVVALAPTPRWGLIALLQAILAAPLVALWGLLRWRRWRLSRATTS